MKVFGFPIAPMILGVVLGDVAELNLNRSLSISTDLTPFVARPWSLLFLILAAFSAIFPWVQRARSRGAHWPRFYTPALCWALAVPLFMMPGPVRSGIAVLLLIVGVFLLWWRRPSAATRASADVGLRTAAPVDGD